MSTKSKYNGKYRSAYTCEKIVLDGNDTKSNNTEGYGNYVDRVGQYGKAATSLVGDTQKMLAALNKPGNFTNDADVYTRVYSKMHPGDFLVKHTASNGSHARLIERVVIKKKNGKIDPDESYVVVTEQTSKMRRCNNLALGENSKEKIYHTTWLLAYGKESEDSGFSDLYSFKALATKNYYLPYRYNGIRVGVVAGVVANSVSSESLSLNWGEINEETCDGYELEYAEDSTFANAETLVFDDSSLNSVTLDELQRDKTYYIRLRSYINNEDGSKEYSGYNNWLKVNLATGGIYRENASVRTEVSEKEYYDYVVNDISYDDDTDAIDLQESDLIESPFFS